MKIHADKIGQAPAHGLRVAELRRILAAVPPAWLTDVTEVRLSNALRRPDFACFNRYDGTLIVYSRGRTPDALVGPIFTELAAHALSIPYRWGHRLSAADTHRLEPLAAQFTAPPNNALQRTGTGVGATSDLHA